VIELCIWPSQWPCPEGNPNLRVHTCHERMPVQEDLSLLALNGLRQVYLKQMHRFYHRLRPTLPTLFPSSTPFTSFVSSSLSMNPSLPLHYLPSILPSTTASSIPSSPITYLQPPTPRLLHQPPIHPQASPW
jgi:hypothetical protein